MPSQQQDIVVIHGTFGTPANYNKAHPHKTILTYTDGNLTKVEEVMEEGGLDVLRKETVLGYTDGNLTSVTEKVFATDGTTVEMEYTDTLNYNNGDLANVERTVV